MVCQCQVIDNFLLVNLPNHFLFVVTSRVHPTLESEINNTRVFGRPMLLSKLSVLATAGLNKADLQGGAELTPSQGIAVMMQEGGN